MYIKVFVDASKIDAYHPCAPGFAHDIFIYGYGDEQAFFSDFLSKHGNKYSNDYAAFPQLDLAYQTLAYKEAIEEKKEHSVALIKVNPDIEAPADMRYVKASVKKYLFPSETSAINLYQHFLRSEQIRMHRPIKAYEGVDVYHYLSNYAYSLYNHGLHYVDIRLFHAMSDHKK